LSVIALDDSFLLGADSLPSGNDKPNNRVISKFVDCVANKCAPRQLQPSERIAVFVHDARSCAEQRIRCRFIFASNRIKTMPSSPPHRRRA